MNDSRKNLIYLKQVYTFQSNKRKFENPKSSLPLKRFIVHLLTTLNPRKLKDRLKCIGSISLIFVFTTANLLHVYSVNIASHETLLRIKKFIIFLDSAKLQIVSTKNTTFFKQRVSIKL